MLLCPLENGAVLSGGWAQTRPTLTQLFGENVSMYAQFGLNGHNGIDFRAAVGTPVFAPCDGTVQVDDQGSSGYGLHIKIRSTLGCREVVLGHLSRVLVASGAKTCVGDLIGYTGNTGYSTGPHLHLGLRRIVPQKGQVFGWSVADYENGFLGYINPREFLMTFKGSLTKKSLAE